MTKKHFIALADALKNLSPPAPQNVLNALAVFCRDQNQRFNRERWFDYIRGVSGPNGGRVKQTIVKTEFDGD